MTGTAIELPPEWTEWTGESYRSSALIECQHTTADKVKLIVSVVPRADEKAYNLHLLTINQNSTPVRQECPVKEYDSRAAAFAGTESFIEHLSLHLRNGPISSATPETEEVRDVIQAFLDERRFSPIHHLISILH